MGGRIGRSRQAVRVSTGSALHSSYETTYAAENRALTAMAAERPILRLGGIEARLVLVHALRVPDPQASPIHLHPYLEVTVVLAGDLTFSIDGRAIRVRSGQAFIAPPNLPHAWRSVAPSSDLLGLMLAVVPEPQAREGLGHRLAAAAHTCGYRVRTPLLRTAPRHLLALAGGTDADRTPIGRAWLELIVGSVLATLRDAAATVPAPDATCAGDPRVATAQAHARAMLACGITSADLAARVSVTQRHLDRLFRQEGEGSVAAWLRRLRIGIAQERLCDPALSLDDVARMSGFADRAALARHFHRRCQCSPADFRRRWGMPRS